MPSTEVRFRPWCPGDCMDSLAVLAGLQRMGTDVPIVWFDAQGDVQILETTESGYVGGMPVRIAVGHRPELIADRLGLRPLPESRAPHLAPR